ncbi:Gfo/Idh/MocA family oxidoreductase [Gammaproteobacteria bacterium]|nr:Gfo/Idh/MocA family oxidoreductase [Gammaproteobacteria bacterium]
MIAHIGCGYWGKNIVRTLDELDILSAVYDFDHAVANDFSKKYGLPSYDLETILDDQSIKGISIATPARTHFSIARQALTAGKSVFIEKPICLDVEEANQLKRIAGEQGLEIMVGHLMHYHCGFLKLKSLIHEKTFGNILRIKSYRKSFGILRHEEDVIWSFAPHDISMVMSFFDHKNVDNLQVLRNKIFNQNTDAALISYNCDGVPVSIDVDWASSYKQQRLEVYCETGLIILDDTLPEGQKLYCMKSCFSETSLTQKTAMDQEVIYYQHLHSPLMGEMSAFKELINNHSQCANDVDEAILVLKILKEIESHE